MDHATPGGARGPRGWPAAPDALAADGLSDVTPAHTDAPVDHRRSGDLPTEPRRLTAGGSGLGYFCPVRARSLGGPWEAWVTKW